MSRMTLVLLFVLILLAPLTAQDAGKPPPKTKVIVERDHIEDGVGRLLRRAHRVEGGHFVEALIVQNNEGDSYITIIKISNGVVAMGFGGADKESDQWFEIEKENVDLVEAAIRRLKAN